LPQGCRLHELTTHADERGELTEILRDEWFDAPRPLRWHVGRGRAHALRGVHLQPRSWIYLCVLRGRAAIGLRGAHPPVGSLLEVGDVPRMALAIPPGVAHGLYFHTDTLYLRAASDTEAQSRCRWDSPGLDIPWPCRDPLLDPADAAAGTYATLAGGA
jgi:dTDP-4-dehydrorhamnose 3,5-epimerase